MIPSHSSKLLQRREMHPSSMAMGELVGGASLAEEHHWMLTSFRECMGELEIDTHARTCFHGILGQTKVIVGPSFDLVVERFGSAVGMI